MATDIKELRKVAQAAEHSSLWHGNKRGAPAMDAFHVAAHPSAVLDLIAHIEQLEGQLSAQTAEPVAWMHQYRHTKGGRRYEVADIGEGGPDPEEGFEHYGKHPLYTHPAKTEQRQDSDKAECKCSLRTKLVGDGCEVCNPKLAEELAQDSDKDAERMFPMQHPNLPIPWALAEIIYAGYSARYGTSQSLERLAERGGFGWGEVGVIYKDGRSKAVIDQAIANGAPK